MGGQGAWRERDGLRQRSDEGIAFLELARPDDGNRITVDLAQALCAACAEIELDEQIHVVALSAQGDDFCLGVHEPGDWEIESDWIAAIAKLTRPVLATIRGQAIGEGFEFALACDLRIAASTASFCLPVSSHWFPHHGGTQRLPRIVGRMRASDLLFTGRTIAAPEAADSGLVCGIYSEENLAREAAALLTSLREKGPVALRYAKEAIIQGSDLTLDQGARLEEDLYALLQTTEDRGEGVTSFLVRRTPRFRGQ